MSRIKLEDTFISSIMKMSDGNPGAVTALMDLANAAPKIDPQSIFGGLAPILDFDTHGIYGSGIYVIWSDKCNRDSRKALMLLRAVQLGFLPGSKLKEMVADQMRHINLTDEEWENLDSQVCDQLKEFQKPNAAIS